MALSDHVYNYCERGQDPGLWAEPLNAVTNGGFLLAAIVALGLLLRRPAASRSADHYLLIALVFIIGLGSLAFHLFATKATGLADTIPIGLFMLIYLAFALNRLLQVPPGWTTLLVIAFAGVGAAAMQLRCFDGGIGFPGEGSDAGPCLNGSVGYLPALCAMLIVGGLVWARGMAAGKLILWAALVFTVSVTFRSLDMALCGSLVYDGHEIGTHFVWHLLNAVTLFLLLLASFRAGESSAAPRAPISARDEDGGSFL
ncbi:ceramidase domain-containing protein [Methyloligella solikamskensis]|uniref:Ceramidase domain-containing protein n=1 Tax=Methyloligella solikamskensis TaxID=1177756 RepID=A0ABW3J9I4_9HYPH